MSPKPELHRKNQSSKYILRTPQHRPTSDQSCNIIMVENRSLGCPCGTDTINLRFISNLVPCRGLKMPFGAYSF